MRFFPTKWRALVATTALAVALQPQLANGQSAPSSDIATSIIDAGMRVEKNVSVPLSDGSILRANVFRPVAEGRYPVLITMSSYGKDIHFEDYNKPGWLELNHLVPEICKGSTCKYLRWETPDPERWVPRGYVVIAVDARGSGQSPGYLDPFSPREARDFYDAIEWAGTQPFSNGKVGVTGISYYAVNEWQVAALRPPHLAAIAPWEGATDFYRDMIRQGGILGDRLFAIVWPEILKNQYGNAETPFKDRETGKRVTGGEGLSATMLAGNRSNLPLSTASQPLDSQWWRDRSANLAQIQVPLLSAGNWGGIGLHLRGNVEGFSHASSQQKWLSLHGGTHFETFYQPQWTNVLKQFFDHFLKGTENGWERTPPVQITLRRPGGEALRYESQWPLAGTKWTKYYLDAGHKTLGTGTAQPGGKVSYDSTGEGATFTTRPFDREMEFTGPVSARLWVSSSTTDMDLFATLRAFGPDGQEVTFRGANDPAAPVSQGWLRVSQRKIDLALSLPGRPWHTHDEVEKLIPGKPYAVDVEIWPTNIVLPRGYRLALTLTGKDFERAEAKMGVSGGLAAKTPFRGSGPLLHINPADRPPIEFGGLSSIMTGGSMDSFLLLPLIPSNRPRASADVSQAAG